MNEILLVLRLNNLALSRGGCCCCCYLVNIVIKVGDKSGALIVCLEAQVTIVCLYIIFDKPS